MPGWDSYPREPRHPAGRLTLPPGSGAAPGPHLGGLGLGNHFDDASWATVLVRRGWSQTNVDGLPGWVSPPLTGLRLLFCVPRLAAGGLDDTPFLMGFRLDASDEDEVWSVIPHGDGELVFDHLVHARAGFDKAAFLRWLSHESMADATRR